MAALAPEAPLTIPVVVHVVYNEQSENISEAQIESQTTVLNQDYAAENADKANVHGVRQGLATDTNIRFALASEDPAGNSTTGITRTTTDRAAFGIDDAVKSAATGGADPWPTDRYLNMWACTLEGGLLGYAQFPGGPPQTGGSSYATRPSARRVQRRPRSTWEGRRLTRPGTSLTSTMYGAPQMTAREEIWSPIRPTRRDQATVSRTSRACPVTMPPNGDMFMNYMNYVDDRAMCMFTAQQVARMMATLDGPRAAFGRS
jgi:hypothetical protein